MTPHLILDCGGRVLTALLMTADGEILPWSQDIRNVATRYVSTEVLFDPRVSEHPDFIWEEALESLAKATPSTFFQRARRIGLRRPWDPQASGDALQLASPLAVLSSATALTDRFAASALPRVAAALLEALLDPVFTFLSDRQFAAGDVDVIAILPAYAGRRARVILHKLMRRRGFRRVSIVSREIAAAMAFVEEPAGCVVVDASGEDLHLQRVSIEADGDLRQFRTVASTTVRGRGWGHWVSRIAAALRSTPSAAFDRTLTALLTGSPDSLESRVTRTTLHAVLDEEWIGRERRELVATLDHALTAIGADDLPVIFVGEIFALAPVRAVFDAATATTPLLDQTARAVAHAIRWLRANEARRLRSTSGGTLRVNTLRGSTVELIADHQLPEAGQSCHLVTSFRFGGEEGHADKLFLVHMMWGNDASPEGNATLCAMPVELQRDRGDILRLTVHLTRSRNGRRVAGAVEARTSAGAIARGRFSQDLEVLR